MGVPRLPKPAASVILRRELILAGGEQIKKGKQATCQTRLPCQRFRATEVRLLLKVLDCGLRDLSRRLGASGRVG